MDENEYFWLQPDDVTCHTASEKITLPNEKFFHNLFAMKPAMTHLIKQSYAL